MMISDCCEQDSLMVTLWSGESRELRTGYAKVYGDSSPRVMDLVDRTLNFQARKRLRVSVLARIFGILWWFSKTNFLRSTTVVRTLDKKFSFCFQLDFQWLDLGHKFKVSYCRFVEAPCFRSVLRQFYSEFDCSKHGSRRAF